MEVKFDNNEIEILRKILSQVAIKKRTGELGIVHGMNRFVSTNTVFRKEQIDILDKVAKNSGLRDINKFDK